MILRKKEKNPLKKTFETMTFYYKGMNKDADQKD